MLWSALLVLIALLALAVPVPVGLRVLGIVLSAVYSKLPPTRALGLSDPQALARRHDPRPRAGAPVQPHGADRLPAGAIARRQAHGGRLEGAYPRSAGPDPAARHLPRGHRLDLRRTRHGDRIG